MKEEYYDDIDDWADSDLSDEDDDLNYDLDEECEQCGHTGGDVKLRLNPYTNELYLDEEEYYFCDSCIHELEMDI